MIRRFLFFIFRYGTRGLYYGLSSCALLFEDSQFLFTRIAKSNLPQHRTPRPLVNFSVSARASQSAISMCIYFSGSLKEQGLEIWFGVGLGVWYLVAGSVVGMVERKAEEYGGEREFVAAMCFATRVFRSSAIAKSNPRSKQSPKAGMQFKLANNEGISQSEWYPRV